MLRYLRSLADKDLALDRTMIPLGSCTMKLNATSEMIPSPGPSSPLHPFAPGDQTAGYRSARAAGAGFAQSPAMPACRLQPNAGSQGEYAGLLVIHAYHAARGEAHRNVCLIPESAHGTNPASARWRACRWWWRLRRRGNIDLGDLQAKGELHRDSSPA